MKKINDVKQKAQETKTRFETKVKKTAEGIKNGVQGAVKWGMENPQYAIAIVGFVISLADNGVKIYTKQQAKTNLREEKELKELYVYDRSLGTYLKLNRPLTTNEVVEVERRREAGEKLSLILRDMRLI